MGLIKGVVTNRQGEHIACAEVRAISSKSPKVASIGQTNLDGQFTFNEVLPGIYKVEVDSPQNEHWVLENLNVVPNSSNDLKVVLGGGVPNKGSVHTIPLVRYPPAALIVGRVLDDRGLFVHDAHVKIIDGSGRTVNSTIPCAMGFFQAYGLVPGTYTVEVFAPGYEKWVEPNVVAPGRNADSLDAKLTAKRVTQLTDKTSAQVFKGSVTDEAGNAISGANVQVTDEKSNATTVEQVNADGQFAFVGLAHGLYTIEITARDFETWVQKHIDVKGPGASELKAVMELVGVRHD
jgi:protocatechuate 3,4-dioxygenase beta subunit